LHTLGGLLGAAVASTPPKGRAGVGIYWLVLAIAVALTPVVGIAWAVFEDSRNGPWGREDVTEVIGGSLFILLMVGPAVQLGASVVAFLVIGLLPAYRFHDKEASIWAVGRITVGMLAGTGIGILVMFLICGVMR
jgi:hypothetical protein